MESGEDPRSSVGSLPRPADVANADRSWPPALRDDVSSEAVLEIATELVERSLHDISQLKPALYFSLDAFGLVIAVVLIAVGDVYNPDFSFTSLPSLGIVGSFAAGIFVTRLLTSRRFWFWRVARGRQLALQAYAESVTDLISARGDDAKMDSVWLQQIDKLRSFAKSGRFEPAEGWEFSGRQ